MKKFGFCSECGAALERRVVAGEPRNHWFCPRCGAPRHDYPMIVVTCFIGCGNRLLFVQRNLEPRRGFWAIPGGFLENGETLAEGAARELYEEAGIQLRPDQLQLYMVGTITFLNQVYVGFRASVETDYCKPGRESIACQFFSRDECPWDNVAYPQVNNAKELAYDELESGRFSLWQGEMTSENYSLRPVKYR